MKKSFAARRAPRKVGQYDEDEDDGSSASSRAEQSSESAVRRPTNKPRKSSSLRQSFRPSTIDNDDDDSEATVITPKRSTLSRIAVQRNASTRPSLLASHLPVREAGEDDERPNYSADALRELKDSTPSTPQRFSSANSTDAENLSASTQALNLSSKFGSYIAHYEQSSAIPSAAEISEKKARRARLAKEMEAEEYVSLDPDDPDLDEDDNVMKDELGRLVLKPKDKYGQLESRLVAEDEDIMENFDDFTEDGKISLGRKAEAEAARKRKQDMAAQIAEAEGGSDNESDDSEQERNAAFEAAQTRHGIYTQPTASSSPSDGRPKTPPIITPLPTLDGAIERLQTQLAEMQSSRMQKLQQMESIQREKIRSAEDEVRIQRSLKETADKFEALRKEKGIDGANKTELPAIQPAAVDSDEHDQTTLTAVDQSMEDGDRDDDDDIDDEEEAASGNFAGLGLGFGGARRNIDAGLGFNAS